MVDRIRFIEGAFWSHGPDCGGRHVVDRLDPRVKGETDYLMDSEHIGAFERLVGINKVNICGAVNDAVDGSRERFEAGVGNAQPRQDYVTPDHVNPFGE